MILYYYYIINIAFVKESSVYSFSILKIVSFLERMRKKFNSKLAFNFKILSIYGHLMSIVHFGLNQTIYVKIYF